MNTYCIKCRKDTRNVDPKIVRTKNNRSKCNQNVLFVELKNQDLLKNKNQKVYYNFFDKKSKGSSIINEPNYQLANEFSKPIVRKFKKTLFIIET